MRIVAILLSACLLTAAEPKQLFNGKDMSGWEMVGPGRFLVEDGMLKTEGGMGLLYYKGQRFGNETVHVASAIYFKEVSVTPGFSVNASPGILTQGDRDRLLSALHATRKQILDAVTELTPAQWTFKPGPDRWSIAEVVEHLSLVEDGLWAYAMSGMKSNTPAPKEVVADEKVSAGMADRSVKAKAPEFAVPKGQWKAGPELTNVFRS